MGSKNLIIGGGKERMRNETYEEQIKERIACGIEEYCGEKPEVVEIYEDPKVPTTYAIRSKRNETQEGWEHWIIIHLRPEWTATDIADNLEECDDVDENGVPYPWPPISGGLKFF